MAKATQGTVTRLVKAIGEGGSVDDLIEVVYGELRSLAAAQLRRERSPLLMQTSSLVNMAYMRLFGGGQVSWESRAHFFGAAAEAMRRILVDEARRRNADKRGGKWQRVAVNPEQLCAGGGEDVDVIALHEALAELEGNDVRQAKIVKLHVFAGLTIEETAAALDLSTRTVNRDWRAARTWLYRELNEADGADSSE